VVRAQRGAAACAAPTTGLEIRRDRQCIDVHSEPRASGFLPEGGSSSSPTAGEARAGLWTTWARREATAAAGMGIRDRCRPIRPFISSACRMHWLQAMEGGIDSSHSHSCTVATSGSDPRSKGAKATNTTSPTCSRISVVEQPGGLYIGARRNAENRQLLLAHHALGDALLHHDPARRPTRSRPLRIPIGRRELLGLELRLSSGARAHPARGRRHARGRGRALASTTPGTYRPLANKDNDYLIDRAAQKAGEDLSGVAAFDPGRLAAESMGTGLPTARGEPRFHRQRDHHGAPPLDARGEGPGGESITPPGVDSSAPQGAVGSVVLPPDQAFKDAAKEALTTRPGVAQTDGVVRRYISLQKRICRRTRWAPSPKGEKERTKIAAQPTHD